VQIKTTLSEPEIKKIAHDLGMELLDFQNHGYMPRRALHRYTGMIRNVTHDAKMHYASRSVGWSGGRNMPTVPCWHGYYDFMNEIYAHDPFAEIQTGRIGKIIYRNQADFLLNANKSKYAEVGSQIYPAQYIDKCNHG
jgi:hypothetical protein